MAIAEVIFTTVFKTVLDKLLDPSTPVENANAEKVASAVTKEIAPIVVNASNAEPWYQSRVFIGLLTAGLGYVGSKIGLVIGETETHDLINIVAAIVEAAGLLYAWYGRVVGAKKKPLGA